MAGGQLRMACLRPVRENSLKNLQPYIAQFLIVQSSSMAVYSETIPMWFNVVSFQVRMYITAAIQHKPTLALLRTTKPYYVQWNLFPGKCVSIGL